MSETDRKIVVIGTVFADIKGRPLGEFIPDGRNAGVIEYSYGGVARNIAEDLTGCGEQPVFVGLIDQSAIGREMLAKLEAAGADVSFSRATERGMGTWMAIFNEEGDVWANISARPNLEPLCGILDENAEAIFGGADGILLEIDMPESVVSRIFNYAERYGVKTYGVISNMTIASERIDYIKRTACFICNRQEAGQLFGADMSGLAPRDVPQLMRQHMERLSIGCMVVTLGEDGAAYVRLENMNCITADGEADMPDGAAYVRLGSAGDAADAASDAACAAINANAVTAPAMKVMEEGTVPALRVQIVDTTGAGDAFFAGASLELIKGSDLNAACLTGTKMSAFVIGSKENVYRP